MAGKVIIARGNVLPVSWFVGSAGLEAGLAQASLSLLGRGTVRLGPEVSVPPFAGIEGNVPPATVALQWQVNSPPGVYQAFTTVFGVDPGSSFIETEFFPLEVFDPQEG